MRKNSIQLINKINWSRKKDSTASKHIRKELLFEVKRLVSK